MIFLIMGKAGSGKDTVAQIMKNKLQEPTAITHYAGYLKWLYSHYFNWNGEKSLQARTDLQIIGTDIVRNTYDEDFWVDRVIEQIQIFNGHFDHFIIPDARFENEIEKVIETFGSDQVITIRVVRPNYESDLTDEQKQHESEIALDNYPANFTFINSSLEELEKQVDLIISSLQKNQGGLYREIRR